MPGVYILCVIEATSSKTEGDYLYGWTGKWTHMQKSHQKKSHQKSHLGYIAGTAEEEEVRSRLFVGCLMSQQQASVSQEQTIVYLHRQVYVLPH